MTETPKGIPDVTTTVPPTDFGTTRVSAFALADATGEGGVTGAWTDGGVTGAVLGLGAGATLGAVEGATLGATALADTAGEGVAAGDEAVEGAVFANHPRVQP